MPLTAFLLTSWLSLQTVDVVQSCTHGSPLYRELNPLVPNDNCPAIVAEVAGLSALSLWTVQSHVKGKWKRRIIFGALTGIEAAVVYHNAQVFRQVERGRRTR